MNIFSVWYLSAKADRVASRALSGNDRDYKDPVTGEQLNQFISRIRRAFGG